MKHSIQSCLSATIIGAFTSIFLVSAVNAAEISTKPVVDFADGTTITGMSTLVRTGSGVAATVETSDIPNGEAVTIWFVVFNEPDNCTGGECGEDDVFEDPEPAMVSVVFGTGHVVGNGDHASFAAHISQDDTDGALFGPGLVNPLTAEIHLIVRGHGTKLPRSMPAMIHSVDGGCDVNTCEDFQFSVHFP